MDWDWEDGPSPEVPRDVQREGSRRRDDTPSPAADTPAAADAPSFADAVERFDQTAQPDDDERTRIFRPPVGYDEAWPDAGPSDEQRRDEWPDVTTGPMPTRTTADRAAARARRRKQIRRRRIVALAVIVVIVVLLVVLVVRGCGGPSDGQAATEAARAVMACLTPDGPLPALLHGP